MSMFRSTRRQSAPDFDLLVPEARVKRVEKRNFDNDVVDAEFIDLNETVSRDYGNDNRAKAGLSVRAEDRLHFNRFFVVLGALERRLCNLSIDGFAAVIAAVVIFVFVLCGGFSLFSSGEATVEKASRPLGISYVNVTPQYVDGQDILVISGIIENHSQQTLEVPRILASLSAEQGEFVASMIIQSPVSEIKPGNSHGFSAKLRHPGGKTPEIKLSFAQTDVSQR